MPEDSANDPELSPHASAASRGIGSLLRIGGLIALGSLFSRVLGFAGDTIKSHYFGAGGVVDAFNVAAAVPTLLYDLLITSLVNSAYIPVFSSYGKAERWRLAIALLNVTCLVFSVVVLLMEAFAPQLVNLLSGGSSVEVQALTVNLLHITLPVLLILNISGIFSALLYSHQRLLLPTVAGAVFNAAILVAALTLHAQVGIFALALGLLLGAVLQVIVQLYGLLGASGRYQFTLWDAGLRRVAVLYLPILAGLLVEILISRPATFALASQTGEGGISWMNYALTLRQLPEALIAAALSVAVLVRLSAAETLDAFRAILAQGLQLALLLILPASVGLFLLAHPVTALLFEHGSFTAFDTQVTAQALQWYVVGLPFATIDLLLVVAFYARHNTRTPALIGLFCTIVYIFLAEILLPHFGLNSLMLSDSFKFVLHTAISSALLFSTLGSMSGFHLYRVVRHALFASIVMGVVVGGIMIVMPPAANLIAKLLAVLIPVLAGLLIYSGTLAVFYADELRLLLSMLRSKDR